MVAYAVWKGNIMVVAFRGTDDVEDWIVNCNCLSPEPTEDGGVHAGFKGAYKTMRDDIRSLVRAKDPEFVWITGHSLGGALATVCAYDLYKIDRRRPTVHMTFGQPMVATLDMSNSLHKKLDGRFVHFANREDPVPRVPSFSYRHFSSLAMFSGVQVMRRWDVYKNRPGQESGDEVQIDRKDLPPLSPEQHRDLQERIKEERKSRIASAPGGTFGWTVPSLAAHGMQLYLDNVRAWITNDGKRDTRLSTGANPRGAAGPIPRRK